VPKLTGKMTARRRLSAVIFAAAVLPLMTVITTAFRSHLEFAADVPLYLLVVVVTSLIGGFYPALSSAVAASLLLNYYFVAPVHTFTIERASSVVALVVFLLIAALVSRVVDRAAHGAVVARADEQRTALLNAVGHDLRTPISVAKAAVASLRASDVPWTEGQRRELLATAEDALDRLTSLVTNLLDLSRLQAGVLPVVLSKVGLEDVVAQALEYVDAPSRIVVDVPADLPEVVADAGLLERVIANVVQNAVRYAPDGTEVQIVGRPGLVGVDLRVVDRGPGVDVGRTETIFQPFQRTDDSPATGDGLGLGLPTARGFAQAMGGDVELRQTPGGGTTVLIRLRVST
jgi:two-component system sensor histidine kinase KdpD